MDLQIIRIAATVLIGLGTLFVIVGLATHSWQVLDVLGTDYTSGLWQFCLYTPTDQLCDKLPDVVVTSEYEAVRAFAILSVLIGLGAIGLSVVLIVAASLASNKVINLVAAVLAFIAGALAIVAIIIFAAAIKEDLHDYGYSFILTIVGALFCGVGGGASIAAMMKTE